MLKFKITVDTTPSQSKTSKKTKVSKLNNLLKSPANRKAHKHYNKDDMVETLKTPTFAYESQGLNKFDFSKNRKSRRHHPGARPSNIRRTGTVDVSKKVDFKESSQITEDEEEDDRIKRVMEERSSRPCTKVNIKFMTDSVTKVQTIRLRKNSFSPADFLPNDRYRTALINEDIKGWSSVARCIAKHTSNVDVSGVVSELFKHKHIYTKSLRNPMKKYGTIYQKKGAIFNTQKEKKDHLANMNRLDYMMYEAMNMKKRFNQSKDYLSAITSDKKHVRNSFVKHSHDHEDTSASRSRNMVKFSNSSYIHSERRSNISKSSYHKDSFSDESFDSLNESSKDVPIKFKRKSRARNLKLFKQTKKQNMTFVEKNKTSEKLKLNKIVSMKTLENQSAKKGDTSPISRLPSIHQWKQPVLKKSLYCMSQKEKHEHLVNQIKDNIKELSENKSSKDLVSIISSHRSMSKKSLPKKINLKFSNSKDKDLILASNQDEVKLNRIQILRKCLKFLGFYKCLRKIIEENLKSSDSAEQAAGRLPAEKLIDLKCRVTFMKCIGKVTKLLSEERRRYRETGKVQNEFGGNLEDNFVSKILITCQQIKRIEKIVSPAPRRRKLLSSGV
ncbi:unnamed protein product [Moneuplotes crassus]|uniref:Uncharacterized protein n=1 Tax=Euplotes crassus TaxID=5936 RepID=A0AAD1UBB2_EUPCR|nr:unnamed protein product [Moneuplotes crassus]